MFHFYTPLKRPETKGFLLFSGGIAMEHWAKMAETKCKKGKKKTAKKMN